MRSDIFSKEYNNVLNMNRQQIENNNRLIETLSNDNRNYENEINVNLENKREYDERKRNFIYELRNIMENENNHENNLICRPLKEEKRNEYTNTITRFNDFLNHEYNFNVPLYTNSIQSRRDLIFSNKNIIQDTKKYNEDMLNTAIENGRNKIIEKCIDYLKENKLTEEHIKYLNDILENNT